MSESIADLAACRRCSRLVQYRDELRRVDARIIATPVGSWGVRRPAVLIVGLAPGRLGAARSGKAFVGDASGEFLFAGLHQHGYASSALPARARLTNARLTNVVKCLPPGNAPTPAERQACAHFLEQELGQYCPRSARTRRVIICLGGVAYQAVRRTLRLPAEGFHHGIEQAITDKLTLLGSYHPSRLNVNTGRMTPDMLSEVLVRSRQLIAP